MSLPPAEKTAAFLQKKTVLAKGGCASFFSFLFHLRLLKFRRFNPSAPGASLPDGRQLFPQIWLAALAASKTRRDRGRSGLVTRRWSLVTRIQAYRWSLLLNSHNNERHNSGRERREHRAPPAGRAPFAKLSTPPADHQAKYTCCSILIAPLKLAVAGVSHCLKVYLKFPLGPALFE